MKRGKSVRRDLVRVRAPFQKIFDDISLGRLNCVDERTELKQWVGLLEVDVLVFDLMDHTFQVSYLRCMM